MDLHKAIAGAVALVVVGSLATLSGHQQTPPRRGQQSARPRVLKTNERIADAAERQDDTAVRRLIGQRVDVNIPQADGATALHWAAHWNDLGLTDLLLKAGARANAANDYGVVPLLLACTNGNAAVVERLLRGGADPNAPDNTGTRPLMFAARAGNVDVVKTLLARGADVNLKNSSSGQTALMWAASAGNTAIQRALIAAGADVRARSKNGYTALMFAAREGHLESVQNLLDNKADVNEAAADGATPLVLATVLGHWPLAEFLLDHGTNPNADGTGFTALHWAAGIWETNLTTTGEGGTRGYDIFAARGPGKHDLVKSLLAHGADPNARMKAMPPMFGFHGSFRMSMVGATPFIIAAKGAEVEIMRMLLAAGANPWLTTSDGSTALMAAAGYAYAIGADIQPQQRALEAAKLIIERLADVNAANTVGETALHGAAYTGWEDVAQLLLDNGAFVDARNIVDWTPLAIAQGYFDLATMTKTVHPKVIALLKKYGAEPTPPSHEQKRLRY